MKTLVACIVLGLVAACAHAPPKQLVDARRQYDAALLGPAASSTPADLYEAKKALDTANAEYAAKGDSAAVRSWAYVASRKVELADAKARIEEDRLRTAQLNREATLLRESRISSAQSQLEATRKQLEEEQRATEASRNKLADVNQQLSAEREARRTAESKLERAMKDLSTVAAVKEERRGMVITLSGSVLFAPGQSNLLATAQDRLDQVAATLKDQLDGQHIVVEGHTDNLGPRSYNDQLSTLRAMAVRDYLVSRGVPANQIEAKGYGSSRPLTSNETPDSRANNRRVEIVVQPVPSS